MAEVGLTRLAVVVTAANAAAVRGADHHRAGVFAAGAVPHLRGFADDLVEARVDEVEELDLGDRAHAVEGHADAGAENATLAERRVEAAGFAELFVQAHGGAKDPALLADVFAEHDHAVVVLHLGAHRIVDGLEHRHDLGAGRARTTLLLFLGCRHLSISLLALCVVVGLRGGSGRLRRRRRPLA